MEQRKIKFRAWHKKESCFLDWLCIRQTAFNRSTEQGEYGLMYKVFTDYGADQFVLQQFTGLKDKNGKEIYEGDILQSKTSFGDATIVGKVIWANEVGMWKVEEINPEYNEREYLSEVCRPHHETVIIGNIHETPELLSPTAPQAKD